MRFGRITRRWRGAWAAAVLATICLLPAAAKAAPASEFGVPAGAEPQNIVAGPDGNLWFTAKGAAKGIYGMTPQGALARAGWPFAAVPLQLVVGWNGDLWFTIDAPRPPGFEGLIGHYDIATGSVEWVPLSYPPAGGNYTPEAITRGPGPLIWFSANEKNGSYIVPFNPVSRQVLKPCYVAHASERVNALTAGADGNIWYATTGKLIGRVNPLTCYNSEENYPTPSTVEVKHMALGPDGNVWYADEPGSQISRIAPNWHNESFPPLSEPTPIGGIAAGPEGNMWFTYSLGAGSISPATGRFEFFVTGFSPNRKPTGIAAGPDGNMWVAESGSGGGIARIIPNVPPVVSLGAATGVSPTAATLTGAVRSRGAATHYYFEYGPTPAFGGRAPEGQNGAGDTAQGVAATVGGLTPGTTYYYRLVAINEHGRAEAGGGSFTTPRPLVFSVADFKSGFKWHAIGRNRLWIDTVAFSKVMPGDRLNYYCVHCSGRHRSGAKRVRSHQYLWHMGRLVVSSRSQLIITVTAPDGSSRTHSYQFRPASEAEPVSKVTVCHAAGVRTPIACPF